jgi:ParB/RepB/Spo0J family partition protein
MTITTLPLGEIVESKLNPRRDFAKEPLDELAESIRKVGVLQPVLVRPLAKNGKAAKYELVAGHRRLRAAEAAGLAEIPVTVRELTDEQVLAAMVIENLHRADLHPLEEAEGYRKLHKDFKHSVEDLAAKVGKSVAYVYARLKLCELTKEAKKAFLEDRITAGHAILLARLKPEDQERALDEDERALFETEYTLFDEKPRTKARSVREFEAWIADHVRFDVATVDQMVFPETAAAVGEAEEKDAKVLQITRGHYVQEEAREGKTYCEKSWKRADGKEGSKTCEHSELGVIVVGRGQGEAFRVCVKKEKCEVHWGKEIRAKKRAKAPEKSGTDSAKSVWEKEEAKRKAERERAEAEGARWKKAAPAILKVLAEKVNHAPAKAKGLLAQIILQRVGMDSYQRRRIGDVLKLVPLGTTAEDLVRHLAWNLLCEDIGDQWGPPRELQDRLKAFGLDPKKLLDEHAPEEKKKAKEHP